MKQRVLSLFMALLGIAAGAQAQNKNSVYVGTQSLSDGTYEAGDLTALTEGSVTYNSSLKRLTLDNAVINNESGNGLRITVSGLTVKLVGECVINASNYGLDLYGDVTITVDGTSPATIDITSSDKSGIHFYQGCTLTISNNVKVSAEGKEYGICGRNSSYLGKLAMTDQYTELWFKGGTACIKYMDLSDGPQRHGYAIYYPVGAKYQAGTKTIVDADGNEVKDVWVLFQKGISIDEVNFPDENFRNWILAQDYGSDGVLNDTEIAAVTEIQVRNEAIGSLQGIEFFTALTRLECEGNPLTALDVSKNTALTVLWCEGCSMKSLDVSGCKELTNLYCDQNELTTLDVSHNKKLKELDCHNNLLTSLDVSGCTALTDLICFYNSLIYLNVEFTSLNRIECYGNQIRGEGMEALINSLPAGNGTLYFYKDSAPYGNEGNEITLEQFLKATFFNNWSVKWWGEVVVGDYVTYNWIDYEVFSIDEANFPDANFRNYILAQSYGEDGVLFGQEITTVKEMSVSGKEIANLKGIEIFTALTYLNCGSNQLTALDVSKNWALTTLQCDGNRLTALDVSNNTKLEVLHCNDNQLDALDVSRNTELTQLWCHNNQLASLDVSDNTKLVDLRCNENQLKALDVTNITALEELWCYQNAIRGAEMDALVKGLPNRKYYPEGKLYVFFDEMPTGNEIDAVQVNVAKDKNWKVLKKVGGDWMDYEGEPVLTIDEETFPDENFRNWILAQDYGKDGYLSDEEIAGVTNIDVSWKSIESLKGIELFTALTSLYCLHNQLTTLDVSKNTKLETLNCTFNLLNTLDVSKNTELIYLLCYGNAIRGKGMDALVNSLPLINYDHKLKVLYVHRYNEEDEGTVINKMTTAQVAAAKDKGWKVVIILEGDEFQDYEGELEGDANGDGIVNVADAIYVIERIDKDFDENKEADVNGDSKINAEDVIYIVNRIL